MSRVGSIVVAALLVASLSAVATQSASAAAAPLRAAGPAVGVFPVPGSAAVSATTGISFRGLAQPAVPDLRVVGEHSGGHTGRWQRHGDGQGTTFVPDRPFAPSEVVVVRTAQPVADVTGGTWRYRVAPTVPAHVVASGGPSEADDYAAPAAPQPLSRSGPTALLSAPPAGAAPFRSRPDLHPPAVATIALAGRGDGLLFADSTVVVPGVETGDVIYNDAGQVVWFAPSSATPANLQPITYRGQPAVASFRGHQLYESLAGAFGGEFDVWDTAYRQIGSIRTGNGYQADEHELRLNAAGDKALMIVYHAVPHDLSPYGGLPNAVYLEGVVQEIEVATGAVTFEWHTLSPGGISPADSFAPQTGTVVDGVHLNSANYDSDGNILVSSRAASQVLKLDHADGHVLWKLGGKTNQFTFTDGDGGPSFPHDVSRRPDGSVSVFDNGLQRQPAYSRAVSFRLDEVAKTAHVERNIRHSPDLFGPIVGSFRALPNGNDLVSWANTGVATEYRGTDTVFESVLGAGEWTYRTVRGPWHAQPVEPPAIALDRGPTDVTVYASWNGATDVASWELLAGPDAGHLRSLGQTPRSGFETVLHAAVSPGDQVFQARARAAAGQLLGSSPTVDPVQAKYLNVGGTNSFLGAAVGPERPVGAGAQQDFTGGSIYYLPGTGAFEVHGSIEAHYRELGGPLGLLGFPISDETGTADGVGRYSQFHGGSIYATFSTGTHEVNGDIRLRWLALGAETGVLGYPLSDELTAPDGYGRFAYFSGGSVYWTYATGAHEVHGTILNVWGSLLWERGLLGYPVTDESGTTDGQGRYIDFQHGSIYATFSTGTHEVNGDIRNRWLAMGGGAGVLGYPSSNELTAPDGYGRFGHFSGGSVYWTYATGAHEVHGANLALWGSLGWERGFLGYPITDELITPDGLGRYNHFQGGSIYTTFGTGAHEVHGAIRDLWAAGGYERGSLGYPISNEYSPSPGVRRSDFTGGSVLWSPATGAYRL